MTEIKTGEWKRKGGKKSESKFDSKLRSSFLEVISWTRKPFPKFRTPLARDSQDSRGRESVRPSRFSVAFQSLFSRFLSRFSVPFFSRRWDVSVTIPKMQFFPFSTTWREVTFCKRNSLKTWKSRKTERPLHWKLSVELISFNSSKSKLIST